MLCQFVNVNAAVSQNAAVAIDITNTGISGNDAFQTFGAESTSYARHKHSLDRIGSRCGSRGEGGRGECNFLLYAKKPAGSIRPGDVALTSKVLSWPEAQGCLTENLLLKF